MRKIFFFVLTLTFYLFYQDSFAQNIIMNESFGSAAYFKGNASDYTGYSSSASFETNNSVVIQTGNSSGYEGASGNNAIDIGDWSTIGTQLTISNINTSEFTNAYLGFGIIWSSNGWGECALTNNFIAIEYSTNGTDWIELDKGALRDETEWPCDNDAWKFVKLRDTVASSSTLSIRFSHTSSDGIHPYKLDDITIFGNLPDDNPPSQPVNLKSSSVQSTDLILTWNSSTDDQGVSFYEIFLDGSSIGTTIDSAMLINYLSPGTSPSFSVVAYDVAGNPSEKSAGLQVTLPNLPADFSYAWQDTQAIVLPNGDLKWSPKEFVFEAGESQRYIDFENGDDGNDGLTPATPWRHHPWDATATNNAAACTGIHTYIFKRGVVYRGILEAKESGNLGNPIRLTSDPSWGTGEACIYGSELITEGWQQDVSSLAPEIPDGDKVWYIDLPGFDNTKTVCQLKEDTVIRLRVARLPNYKHTPDEPQKHWWSFTSKSTEGDNLSLVDANNLKGYPQENLEGATVWATEDVIVMCTLWKQNLLSFNSQEGKITVQNQNFGGVNCKYYIENTPYLLDTTNEFYYDNANQRLYLRLEADEDPNTTKIEVGKESKLIEIATKSNIVISGLTFGFTTNDNLRYGSADAVPAIKMRGISSGIEIKNCKFLHLNGGILAVNSSDQNNPMQNITVSDNEMICMTDFGIIFQEKDGVYAENINILRNKISDNGFRHLGRWYSSIPAVLGYLVSGEIAGNFIEYSWGNGLDFFWGKSSGSDRTIPFIRGLVHHNKVSHSLMGTNDYGGIESWQGGPAYFYNNISHDAQGYKYNWKNSLGYAYYFDAAFKNYCFNNIASGTGYTNNSAAYMQVLGFYNMYVHNVAYNLASFSFSGNGTLSPDGQNCYLANIGENIELQFNHRTRLSGLPFESYANNIFSGEDFLGNFMYGGELMSFNEFHNTLNSYNPDQGQVGYETSFTVLENPANGDFRPSQTGEAIDKGVKFFAPYPLNSVVGEWHFYKHNSDSSLVKGDNFYCTNEFVNRNDYKNVPKNHMKAYGLSDTSYIMGELEDWTKGALYFDGINTYCEALFDDFGSTICNNLDMTANDFILEAYFKTEESHVNGVVISKYNNNGAGYQLDIDNTGNVRFSIMNEGTREYALSGSKIINDANWHHIFVEVDRERGIDIYIDGELSNGSSDGIYPESTLSLTNNSDFYVGKDLNGNFFHGVMDFIRVSKGNLRDARTTVHELYKWNFDGPFLYDFAGKEPIGKRDAGALEGGSKLCDLVINPSSLTFEEYGGTEELEISAAEGYEIVKLNNNYFFDTTWVSNNLSVVVGDFADSLGVRNGEVWVFGCNETRKVLIKQNGAACLFELALPDTVFVTELGGEESFLFQANNGFETDIQSENLILNITTSESGDSIIFQAGPNTESNELIATVNFTACDTVISTVVKQDKAVGINSLHSLGIKYYPNPVSSDKLFIDIPATSDNYEISIKSLTGRTLYKDKIYSGRNEININLLSGMYLIEISNKKEIYSSKLIVN